MRINKSMFRRLRSLGPTAAEQGRGEMYYWLLGYKGGQRLVAGPYSSSMEAQSIAKEKMDSGRWKVVPLRTRDATRAKQILRHHLVTSQNMPVDNAMQPMRNPDTIRSID